MRESKTLRKFREGRCARITGLGHYIPFYVRHAAHVGYDLIWLDLEHRGNVGARGAEFVDAMPL